MDEIRIDMRIKDDFSEERKEELKRSTILCHKINQTMPYSDEQKELIKELFVNGIGEGTVINPPLFINRAYNIYIGKNCSIQNNFKAMSSGKIIIEDNVLIACGVTIITNNHDFYDRKILTVKDVHIKENAWIGAGAIILPGITIGKNAIVGAGSVVTHDVGDYEVVAGNPARVIRVLDNNSNDNKNDYLLTIYDLDNAYIKKNSNKDIYLVLKNNDSVIIAEADTYNEVIVLEGTNKLFILGDSIRCIDLDKKYDKASDYKIYGFDSSYYDMYLSVTKYNDNNYLIKTDDEDIIIAKFSNDSVKFIRVFDYEMDKLDDFVGDL